jgi:hypothetical protein
LKPGSTAAAAPADAAELEGPARAESGAEGTGAVGVVGEEPAEVVNEVGVGGDVGVVEPTREPIPKRPVFFRVAGGASSLSGLPALLLLLFFPKLMLGNESWTERRTDRFRSSLSKRSVGEPEGEGGVAAAKAAAGEAGGVFS